MEAEEIVQRWHKRSIGRDCDKDELAKFAGLLCEIAEPLVIGLEYVTLDGELLDVREGARFEGIHARHELAVLPHAAFRNDKAGLCAALDRRYWVERAVQGRGC